jgi:hypothetical protein
MSLKSSLHGLFFSRRVVSTWTSAAPSPWRLGAGGSEHKTMEIKWKMKGNMTSYGITASFVASARGSSGGGLN